MKRELFAALSGASTFIIVGILVFLAKYQKWAKQKDWEDATRGLSPAEIVTATEKRAQANAATKKRTTWRYFGYATVGVAIFLYLCFGITKP